MDNYQSPLKRAFEGGFNGDAPDSTEFCVVNCITNRSVKSFSRRERVKKSTSRRNFCRYWLVYIIIIPKFVCHGGVGHGVCHAVPKVPGSIPGTGTHIFLHFFFFFSFFSLLIITFPLFYFFFSGTVDFVLQIRNS